MKILRLLLSLLTASSAVAAQSGPNDKEVLVRGWKNEELRRILDDFKAMYRDRLAADFTLAVRPMLAQCSKFEDECTELGPLQQRQPLEHSVRLAFDCSYCFERAPIAVA